MYKIHISTSPHKCIVFFLNAKSLLITKTGPVFRVKQEKKWLFCHFDPDLSGEKSVLTIEDRFLLRRNEEGSSRIEKGSVRNHKKNVRNDNKKKPTQ